MAELSKLLGLRIRELCKSKHRTQAQLAEAIGMETTNLCKLENGCQFPKEENIEKLATFFNIAIKELFDFEHFKPSKALQNELILAIKSASAKDLATYYRLISVAREQFS